MKISMILTSLIVAMSAMSLSACNSTDKTDASNSSAGVIQESEQMKNEATDEISPAPAPPAAD